MAHKKKFTHWDIKIPSPKWNSDLPRKIIDLEKLRDKKVAPDSIDLFLTLKIIFQTLENWASARIEGNQTRLLDALSPTKPRATKKESVDQMELENLKKAINYVETYCKDNTKISLNFMLDVHRMVVEGLPIGENQPGDETPGKLRVKEVEITKSDHVPPLGIKVPEYMQELVDFANKKHSNQNYLLAVAVFHHRFTWIHPFNNGNGRVVRLMTYAMLQLMGYGVTKNRILNPTAIFFADREKYYNFLGGADKGNEQGILAWADYFLGGLIEEINKIDRLLDRKYVINVLLSPILKRASEGKRISDDEYKLLNWTLNQKSFTFVSSDINLALDTLKSPLERSRMLKRMKELELIIPAHNSKQKYVLDLLSPIFIVFLIDILRSEGFVESEKQSSS